MLLQHLGGPLLQPLQLYNFRCQSLRSFSLCLPFHGNGFYLAYIGANAAALTVLIINIYSVIFVSNDCTFGTINPTPKAFHTFFFVKNWFEYSPTTGFPHSAFFRIRNCCNNIIFLQKPTSTESYAS